MEIYLNVKLEIFAEIVGFGPVQNERFAIALGFKPRKKNLPPLVVQLNNGEIFVCEFNNANFSEENTIRFNYSYITHHDFKTVNFEKYFNLLVKDKKPINLDLGDSWDNERFLTWRYEENQDFLKKIPIKKGFCPGLGFKIARRLELIYELEIFMAIRNRFEKDEKYRKWLSEQDQIKKSIQDDIPWLLLSEQNKIVNTGNDSNKPGLDFYDNLSY